VPEVLWNTTSLSFFLFFPQSIAKNYLLSDCRRRVSYKFQRFGGFSFADFVSLRRLESKAEALDESAAQS